MAKLIPQKRTPRTVKAARPPRLFASSLPASVQSQLLDITQYIIDTYSNITAVYLGGSYAAGRERSDSDLDIMLDNSSHSQRADIKRRFGVDVITSSYNRLLIWQR